MEIVILLLVAIGIAIAFFLLSSKRVVSGGNTYPNLRDRGQDSGLTTRQKAEQIAASGCTLKTGQSEICGLTVSSTSHRIDVLRGKKGKGRQALAVVLPVSTDVDLAKNFVKSFF